VTVSARKPAVHHPSKGQFLVSRVPAGKNLLASIETAVNLVGGFRSVIKPGDVVTIKPNMNTADPYPASSDPHFIKALGEAVLDAGAGKLRIIESSMTRKTTRKVAEEIGLTAVAEKLGAELIFLDEHPWIKQDIPRGKYLKRAAIGEAALEPSKLILAPCLKTHRFARFTASMKLLLGLMKPQYRIRAHLHGLQYKLVDLASFFHPALIVMDARKCFVTGGPMSGQVESPNVILASKDMVAIDVEGVKIIQSYNAPNLLDVPVWELPQVKHAVALGLGAKSDADIELVQPH
jgi:uncharacterized protein (DUF362 family)